MSIKIEGGHEHPFLYAAIMGNETGIVNGNLALNTSTLSEYRDKVKEGYKTATDSSFHAFWVKEEYAINNIADIKNKYPGNVIIYNTPEGTVYGLTEVPAFIEGRSQIIENVRGREDLFMKDLKEWINYAKSFGFSSFNDQYIQPTFLSHVLEHTDESSEIYSKLTAINLPWWDLKYISDEQTEHIFDICYRHNIDVGIKILLDGSFGANTAGINPDYSRVFRKKDISNVVNYLKKYNDSIHTISFHAIGNHAIPDALNIFEEIKNQTSENIIPYVSHIEVVDNNVIQALDRIILKHGGIISPQVNFLASDILAYGESYPEIFNKKDALCPIKTFISRYGFDRVKIGTDGMPLSIPYYLVSAYDHPSEKERLEIEELYELLCQNERDDKGSEVKFNIDKFEELLSDDKTRREYVKNPYSEMREEIDRAIIES